MSDKLRRSIKRGIVQLLSIITNINMVFIFDAYTPNMSHGLKMRLTFLLVISVIALFVAIENKVIAHDIKKHGDNDTHLI